jgi:hypothetical protein
MPVKFNWDVLGIGTSLACAIHCAILPLFYTSLPLFGINIIHHQAFEILMLLLAVVIGSISLLHGYRRHHHSLVPLGIFYTGIIFLTLRQFIFHGNNWLLIPAVVLIVVAHVINYRSCRVHNHAHADDCNH